jgi:hypothetical protein
VIPKAIDRVSALRRARRTGKLTRNNVETLEPRVLLSAHGPESLHGPHGMGHDHAEATQVDAQPIGGQDSSSQDSPASDSSQQPNDQVNGQTDSVTSGSETGDPAGSTGGTDLQNFGPILPYPPGNSTDSQAPDVTGPQSGTSSSGGESTGGGDVGSVWVSGPLEGISGSSSSTDTNTSAGSDGSSGSTTDSTSSGVTIIEIIYVDPIPTLPGGWDWKGPNTKHPLNNGSGDGDTNAGTSGGNAGGTQQQTPGNASQGTASGSTNTGKTTSGNQSTPPPQNNQADGSDSNDPQARPQLAHGNGAPPPIYDPGSSGGSATPEVVHAPTPALFPMTPAKPVTPAVDTGAAVVTPLAMTPSHAAGAGSVLTSSAPVSLSVATVAGGHDSASSGKPASEGGQSLHMSGIAAAVPPAFSLTHVIDTTVPAAAKAVTQQIQTAGAVVAGAEAVTVQAIQQSLPAQVTYNFIRFDAASFQDAVAAFANELATIAKPAGVHRSTTRAWVITGTVLAVDAILVGYWRLKKRKQEKARLALARAVAGSRSRYRS